MFLLILSAWWCLAGADDGCVCTGCDQTLEIAGGAWSGEGVLYAECPIGASVYLSALQLRADDYLHGDPSAFIVKATPEPDPQSQLYYPSLSTGPDPLVADDGSNVSWYAVSCVDFHTRQVLDGNRVYLYLQCQNVLLPCKIQYYGQFGCDHAAASARPAVFIILTVLLPCLACLVCSACVRLYFLKRRGKGFIENDAPEAEPVEFQAGDFSRAQPPPA